MGSAAPAFFVLCLAILTAVGTPVCYYKRDTAGFIWLCTAGGVVELIVAVALLIRL